ncbi:hypothetical protein BH20ACI4_BH20ACI4_23560 [soil metagenome]
MNILLDNPLAAMYGPYFLVFYAFFIFFVLIGLSIVKNLSDQTTKLNTPPIPSTIDPYEIAFLRGGTNEVARSVIFSLMRKFWKRWKPPENCPKNRTLHKFPPYEKRGGKLKCFVRTVEIKSPKI